MQIHGVHHIAIKYEGVQRLQKAIDFYHGLLGLPILRQWGEGNASVVMLDAGNCLLELFANSQGLSHGIINHVAFRVDNVDECLEKVRNVGYEIILEAKNQVFPSAPPYAVRIGFCLGPGGEKVEFFCEIENIKNTPDNTNND